MLRPTAQGVATLLGGGKFIGAHFGGIGGRVCASAGMTGDQSHRTQLTSMATPKPTRNMGVLRRVAMARRTPPQETATHFRPFLLPHMPDLAGGCVAPVRDVAFP